MPSAPRYAMLYATASRKWLAKLEQWAEKKPISAALYEFFWFGVKQAWACLFAGLMVGLIIATHFFYPAQAPIARYDFIFLSGFLIQILMLFFKLETFDEAKVIFIYHVTGTIMEVFKTSAGSWEYPEASIFHIGGVPLFSGFMYASIGSYIARSARVFHFRYTNHPPLWVIFLLGSAVYINFFSHHFIPDLRIALFIATGLAFWRTRIYFKVWRTYRHMPMLLSLVLATLFVWIAENIGTLTKTWLYPHQHAGWTMVSFGKYGSWLLLLIVSYALVSIVNKPKQFKEI